MPCQRDGLVQRPAMCRVVYSGALALILLSLAVPRVAVPAGVPNGVWLIHAKVAVQIFACGGMLCGRIVWLQHPRDQAGQLVRDLENPDPALRSVRCAAKLFSGGYSPRTLTIGRTAGSTTLTMERHIVSGPNSVPLIPSSHASISAFRFSVKPGPCSAFHGSVLKAGAKSIVPIRLGPVLRRSTARWPDS